METPASSKRSKDPQARWEAPLWVRGEHGNGERTVPAQGPASPSASGVSPRGGHGHWGMTRAIPGSLEAASLGVA